MRIQHEKPEQKGIAMPVTLPVDEAEAAVVRVLVGNGFSAGNAAILARNCIAAERDGSRSHGLFRLAHYVSTARSGYVDGAAVPVVHDVAPGFLRVDAANGFAQVAIDKARGQLIDKARQQGIAVLAIRRSHHLGALYLDVEPFAEQGFVALAVVNSIPVVAPPGGHRGVFGTNPMAFAAPREGRPPLVFDQASSSMAFGEIQIAAREGRILSGDTGVDASGTPTGDPQAILDGGAINTFGGHKGASIALMVELLCAGLAGADFSFEIEWGTPGAHTARTGETIILIDPACGAAEERSFARRVNQLVQALAAAGQERVPGDRRIAARERSGDSVVIDDDDWQAIHAWIA